MAHNRRKLNEGAKKMRKWTISIVSQKVNKKLAISMVMVVMAVIYLFLLVGLPALENMILPCGSSNLSETANFTTSNITVDWIVGPAVDIRPDRERFKAPLIIYFVPGLVGIYAIVIIAIAKERTK